MKLLTGGPSLDSTLAALVEEYPNVAFAVAWAGTGTRTYEALLLHRAKIRQAVIGTHVPRSQAPLGRRCAAAENAAYYALHSGSARAISASAYRPLDIRCWASRQAFQSSAWERLQNGLSEFHRAFLSPVRAAYRSPGCSEVEDAPWRERAEPWDRRPPAFQPRRGDTAFSQSARLENQCASLFSRDAISDKTRANLTT